MRGRPAPGFELTDQLGKAVSLAQLARHHAVVLTFFDDRCIDICPIVAHEIDTADASLGAAAARVDFVAVNVNPLHTSVSAVRGFAAKHGLAELHNFYFLTGSLRSLERVWSTYQVTVEVEQSNQAVLHTNVMYFLSPGARMLYRATPFANEQPDGTGYLSAPSMAEWSHGIAEYARSALG
ncbi:MAG: SCO family protein [Acidimicrobiales bacterium]